MYSGKKEQILLENTVCVHSQVSWRFACWIAFALFLIFPMPCGAEGKTTVEAFRPGERLTFSLKWTIVPAGEAVLEVLPRESVADYSDAHHFVLTARSSAFIDSIYKVRERIESWADSDMYRSVRYRKKQIEGGTKRDINIVFDWQKMTAQYSNYGKMQEPIPISEGTLDPLSVFYWVRAATLVAGSHVQRLVTDGKEQVLGVAHVIRNERIKVPAGTFDTVLIEPDLSHVGGVFEKSPDAKIQLWISADHRRLPIKLTSKVIIGSFTGELVEMVGVVPLSK